jgi:CubicO group peptidase (beta-lactamase class C family)
MTRKLRGLPMAAPEKQKYMLYNNMMYTVASHLIEVKTGRPFEDFLKEKFFKPLGMTSTHLHPPSGKDSRDRMASGRMLLLTSPTRPKRKAQGQSSRPLQTTSNGCKLCSTVRHPSQRLPTRLSRNRESSSILKTRTWILSVHISFTAWDGRLIISRPPSRDPRGVD